MPTLLRTVRTPFVIALISTVAAAAAVFALWMLRRWRFPVEHVVVDVPAVQPTLHHLRPRDFAGARRLQLIPQGRGFLYQRTYQVDIAAPGLSAEALMAEIQAHIDDFGPTEMLTFEKTRGLPDALAVGDEFFIHITGPWDGPVRTVEVTPRAFAFITLEGHLEAGEIRFEVLDHPDRPGDLRFMIRSWARSSNLITDFFYQTLGLSRLAQTRVWTFFCKSVAERSGGAMDGPVRVTTHRAFFPSEPAEPLWKQYQGQFDHWRAAKLNFDPTQREQFTEGSGWRIDDYAVGLPGEPPGPPVWNGSWQAARKVLEAYEFPDPGLITGIFVPDEPLDQRIMILRARFLVFTFLFGVRIVDVVEEERDGGPRGRARVWGYSYQTLTGHFEMGQITFEVWKFVESGEVEFRIHAFSHTAHIDNLAYRIGFRLFGRSLQRRFARTALARMQQLVLERMVGPTTAAEPVETPDVQPVSTDEAASQAVDDLRAEGRA
jgi:uncharacterized protein (UPF0548 family)